jgi:alpha-tubulin suppressor-like RCC1 family protein
MKCWGRNAAGQLGNNNITDQTDPVNVTNLSAVRAISVGYTHTCAVTRTGAAKCWGQGGEFQIGNNTNFTYDEPTDVSNLSSGVIAIAAGEQHTCAVLDTGAAQCWGWNRKGELGIGSFDQQKKIPQPVVGLNARAIAIAAGQLHTCVLLATGRVQCMGDNTKGQIGNDSVTASFHTPQNVRDITNAVAIAAGQLHTCALLSTGAVQCWGANGSGQVGIDTGTTQRHYPETVQSLGGIATAITTGSTHSCAVLITGAAKCWGGGANGRLGNGLLSNSSSPVSVSGIP